MHNILQLTKPFQINIFGFNYELELERIEIKAIMLHI